MIGSVCYALSSFYYLLLVTRVCGVFQGGVFALAYATAQLLLTLGRYGMRTYQATDTKRIYSFREYGFTRIITCIAMVALSLPYCLVRGYSSDKLLIFLFVAMMKMIDAAEDVYHGEMQRSDLVYKMGQMLALRNLFSCIVFGVVIFWTKNLILTCFVTFALSIIVCIWINSRIIKKQCPADDRFLWPDVKKLFIICFPIFISTFLSLFLYNIPKYAIDQYLTEDYQTYYSILFMPSFVITLFSEIITKPMLTTIAIVWDEDLKRFGTIIGRIFLLVLAGTAFVVLAGHLIGRRLLELIYGVDLSPFKIDFIILLIGGGLSAAVYISYNILISIRSQGSIIIGYLAVSAAAIPLTYLIVSRIGMRGAAWSYFFTCLLLEIIFGTVLFIQYRKKKATVTAA